ncbi:hypothetical protein [Sutcliffiella halmapala]|nr:hypothetical protein [Sutcliffiella halmapala]
MKDIKINRPTLNETGSYQEFKVIEVNISDTTENLFAVVTPVKN